MVPMGIKHAGLLMGIASICISISGYLILSVDVQRVCLVSQALSKKDTCRGNIKALGALTRSHQLILHVLFHEMIFY